MLLILIVLAILAIIVLWVLLVIAATLIRPIIDYIEFWLNGL